MCFRYIGSKARLVNSILEIVGKPNGGVFIDAFSGTGTVASAAWQKGWDVHVNDHLISAAITSIARVTSFVQAQFIETGGYSQAISDLNNAKPMRGFIWREYSPASSRYSGLARMYFTEKNATKIDGIRSKIKRWCDEGKITQRESRVLIADLISAVNRVANTAGTYGCFLRSWQRQSLLKIELKARSLPDELSKSTMSSDDVLHLNYRPEDTVYFDPPYTKRQYAAYYHILETIALGDEPNVEGVGGIRPWKEKASDYCYKLRAQKALENLLQHCAAQRVFISYSTEGHVPLDTLESIFSQFGSVSRYELDQIGRYRPNRKARETGSSVQEVIFKVVRDTNLSTESES